MTDTPTPPQPPPVLALDQAIAEVRAARTALAQLTPRPGVNPARRIRRQLAREMGVSPKKLRQLARQYRREGKARLAAGEADTPRTPPPPEAA